MIRTLIGAAAVAAIVAGAIAAPASATSCYYKNCTEAHKAGEGDIQQGSHITRVAGRDNDGIACEWK